MKPVAGKFRQAANIFLALALVCVLAGVFIYFFTTPEQRARTTFVMSMGFLLFSFIISGLFAARIAFSGDERQPPYTFTQCMFAVFYAVFVIASSITNMFLDMSVINYFLLHATGCAVFVLPMQFINMASIKSSSAKQITREAKNNLREYSSRVSNIISRIEREHPALAAKLGEVRKLSDNLLYSEASDAPLEIEEKLSNCVDIVELAGKKLLAASEQESGTAMDELLKAAIAAGYALKARNEAILRSK